MASKTPRVRRGAERAAPQGSHPDDQALLPRPKHRLLQVRERSRPASQRRPDPGPWRGPQPQHWAEGLWPAWQDARPQRARGLDRLHVAHLLGAGGGGGWPAGPRPDLQGPARRGAAGRPRARDKQRGACRGEKRRQEDLARLRPRPLKSRRTAAADEERKGAGKGLGLPRLAPGPPEKSKGKRGPSRKTGGGGGGPRPEPRGDLDVGALWAAAGGVVVLGKPGNGGSPRGSRSPARAAPSSPGPKDDGAGPYPQEPRWPDGAACGRGASPPPAPPAPRPRRHEGSRWKRELESVFQELFSTNRKLKSHLNRYLESRSGTDTCPSQEQGCPGACGRRGDVLMELGPEPGARPAAPSANLKELLRQLKDRQHLRMAEPPFADEGGPAPRPEEGGLPWCGLPPRPDPRLPQLPPQALAGRAGPAAWPRQSPEQRWRPQLVEVLEVPQLSWEALGTPPGPPGEDTGMTTETETEPGAPPARPLPAHLAHLAGRAPLHLEAAPGCEWGAPAPAPPPPAASSEEEEEEDDRGHSQMIRDLQEQILEQSRSHKQFLDQARRRLQEFQGPC